MYKDIIVWRGGQTHKVSLTPHVGPGMVGEMNRCWLLWFTLNMEPKMDPYTVEEKTFAWDSHTIKQGKGLKTTGGFGR